MFRCGTLVLGSVSYSSYYVIKRILAMMENARRPQSRCVGKYPHVAETIAARHGIDASLGECNDLGALRRGFPRGRNGEDNRSNSQYYKCNRIENLLLTFLWSVRGHDPAEHSHSDYQTAKDHIGAHC